MMENLEIGETDFAKWLSTSMSAI